MHANPTTPSASHATLAFLKHVLPDEGNYAAFWVETKRHFFTDKIHQLAEWIIARDSQGQTVYHACASFDDSGRRRKDNACFARSFWQDVDSQITHPDARYADPQEAAEATLEFCHKIRIPPPLFVGSGGGINNYWHLDNDLDPDTWQIYAQQLKRLCVLHNLAADPSRTADIASILRTPGTHNRKGGIERIVKCGELVGPYSIEQFEVLNYGNERSTVKRSTNASRLAQAIAHTYDPVQRNADAIADSCQQLEAFRRTRGNISEPTWHACIGVIAYCTDGEEKIHDWSSGYPDYTHEETQDYIERAKKTTGATTCAHFHSLNPETCEACQHWQKIKSPISLGREQNTAAQERAVPAEASGHKFSPDAALVDELAKLDPISYDRRRQEAAKQLGVGRGALDKAVERRQAEIEENEEDRPLFAHWMVEPWPSPDDGAELIGALVHRIRSHVVMTFEATLTVALWIMFTWAHAEAAIHSPILMVTSPEAACGKTTLLGLIGFLARRALSSVGISPAALYRSIEKWNPTLITDEADGAFVENEDLRAAVNSGWTRGQGVLRCDGDDNMPRLFPTFCAKAIGLKGKKLPDTTASRAIVIELKRKLAHENVADFRHVDDPGLHELRRKLLRWSNDKIKALANANPTLPPGFSNRVAANWHLLLAVAEAAGGDWADKARAAAAHIAKAKATLDASIGIQLLTDIRTLFDHLRTDRVFSSTLVGKLAVDDEGPWAAYNRGKPLSQKQLATRLREYGIVSETVWIKDQSGKDNSAKGYMRTAFEEVWSRYL
jgi:hypothetical protein